LNRSRGVFVIEITGDDGRFMLDTTADLCRIPSPTGFTKDVVDDVARRLESYGLLVTRTVKGSLVAAFPGNEGRNAGGRLLSAHVDTLGAMVKEIKENGRLALTRLGGYDWSTIEGEYCTVHKRSGGEVTGTILTTKASTHVWGKELSDLKRDEKSIEVRLDMEATDAETVRAAGVSVGDFVSLDPRTTVTDNGFIKTRHLDDKACVAILIGLAKVAQESGITFSRPAYLYVSTYEEVGHGTSAGVPAGVTEVIAVDMAAVGEGQTSNERSTTICVKDGSGPYDYELSNHLIDLAKANGIDHRIDIYTYYASDVSQALRAGYDVRGALVGPGIDGSHSYERLHQQSLEETAKLLLAYLVSE
jgi:putative aminopeptidase FrvX